MKRRNTDLTKAQEIRLDRLEKEHPDAKVVAWSTWQDGPVVLYPGSRALLYRIVNPYGRLVQVKSLKNI